MYLWWIIFSIGLPGPIGPAGSPGSAGMNGLPGQKGLCLWDTY